LRSAVQEVEALRAARSGHICVGCGPSEATRLLPIALERLRSRAPGISVTVLYGLNEALMPMVRHGEVDLAVSSIPARCADSELRQVKLHEDRAAVIVRSGSESHSRPIICSLKTGFLPVGTSWSDARSMTCSSKQGWRLRRCRWRRPLPS
jgi:DNA-binding transcriptional LysR family regulator